MPVLPGCKVKVRGLSFLLRPVETHHRKTDPYEKEHAEELRLWKILGDLKNDKWTEMQFLESCSSGASTACTSLAYKC